MGAVFSCLGHVRIPAIQNAPLLPSTNDGEGFPCIVFSHGLGGNRLMYSTYCCELASQGCVVAIVEHRLGNIRVFFNCIIMVVLYLLGM